MRYLVIEGGRVANIALAADPLGPNWVRSDEGAVGWIYDPINSVLMPPVEAEPTPTGIRSVSMRQGRRALRLMGKLHLVDELIDGLPEPLRTDAYTDWNHSAVVEIDDPTVQMLAVALELDLPALFDLAETL